MNDVRFSEKANVMPTYRIKNGGWHLTFMGGVDKVIEKVKAFAHQEFNKPEFTDIKYIMNYKFVNMFYTLK